MQNPSRGLRAASGEHFDLLCHSPHPALQPKKKHSQTSPIWMIPGQVFHDPLAQAAAEAIADCANGFANSGFKTPPPGCEMTLLGQPWVDAVRELGTACSANDQCGSTYCDTGWGTSQTNLCMPNRNGVTGQPCSNDNQCTSLHCGGLIQSASGGWIPGTCADKKGLSTPCTTHDQCGSGYCDKDWGTSQTWLCMPNGNGQSGQLCSNWNQCASHVCVGLRAESGKWIPGLCQ